MDGKGTRATPYRRPEALCQQLSLNLWVKDETGHVAVSHKARHLLGILPYLDVAEGGAAAVLARAALRPLQVFVPSDAKATVLARLRELGAQVGVCPREPGERGEPCERPFQQAVVAGALPSLLPGQAERAGTAHTASR